MEIFKTYKPQISLAPYIQHYWTLKIEKETPITERVIPFGYTQLIFHREEQMYAQTSNEFQPRTFVGGMASNYTDLHADRKIDMFVIAFCPEGARAFLNIPLQLFYNHYISTDDLEDKPLKELGKIIQNEPDDEVCIQLIENTFLKKLQDINLYNIQRMSPVIQSLNHNPEISVSNLASLSCLSTKQFSRIFTEYVGTTPKEFQRIVRFQRTLFLLESSPCPNLAQLAVEAGYYDQSHLIKEFKQFSGYTPLEFIALCTPHSDYFESLK